MENDKIINNDCWVAYFDILGFKDKVMELKNHLDVCSNTQLEPVIAQAVKRAEYWEGDVHCVHFSDSFLFFTKDDKDESFAKINQIVTHFFWATISQNDKPLRGALAMGQFYADLTKDIFLGPALIRAIEYEQKQNWIGLVLTPEVSERLNKGMSMGYIDKYKEYDVPVKNKEPNRENQTQKNTEKLFVYYDPALMKKQFRMNIEQMQKTYKSKNPTKFKTELKVKFDNTLNFLNSI